MEKAPDSCIDLHLHSSYSDGMLSPSDIIKEFAVKKKLSAVALTDHDTISGIEEIQKEGKKQDIEVIPGIELSAYDDKENQEIHMLGYYIDYKNKIFLEKINHFALIREKRIDLIIDKLKECSINVEKNNLVKGAQKCVFGRLHIARELVRLKKVKNISEAFNKYLSYCGPAYVPKAKISPEEAIDIINKANGIAVLAHPKLSIKNDSAILNYINAGLNGIEVYYSKHKAKDIIKYKKIAKENNLCITGGSDFHGDKNIFKHLDSDVYVPYSVLERMKALQIGIRIAKTTL